MSELIKKIFKTEKAEFGTKVRGFTHLKTVPSALGGLTRYYAREHFKDNITLLIAQVYNEGKTFSKDIFMQGTRTEMLDPFMLEFIKNYGVNISNKKQEENTNNTKHLIDKSFESILESSEWNEMIKNTFKKDIPDFVLKMEKIKQILDGGFEILYIQDNEKVNNSFHVISCVFVKTDVANGNGYIIFKPFEVMESVSTVKSSKTNEKRYILNDLPFITFHESILK